MRSYQNWGFVDSRPEVDQREPELYKEEPIKLNNVDHKGLKFTAFSELVVDESDQLS